MIGPILVHQRLQFATFNYFLSTLVGSNKNLWNLMAFGTDGDQNLTDACGHNFPYALQLCCFLHFKRNLQEKLRDLGIPKVVADQFLSDVVGRVEGNVRIEDLVDAASIDDFDRKFEALKEPWNTRESPYCGDSGPQFYNHFTRFHAEVIRHHMRKDLRELVGLGSPPAIYTTNASEALNSVLKKGVNYKESQTRYISVHQTEVEKFTVENGWPDVIEAKWMLALVPLHHGRRILGRSTNSCHLPGHLRHKTK